MPPRFVLLCISCLALSGAACYDASQIVPLGTESGWSFRQGFSEDWLEPTGLDANAWTPIPVPTNFRSRDDMPADFAGSVTLRRELPPRLKRIAADSQALAFFSGHISDVAEIYINGRRIAALGSPPPDYVPGSYRSVLADVSRQSSTRSPMS